MKLLERTEHYEIYLSFFEGIPVRFKKDIKTGAVLLFAEDVAKVLDYESLDSMMGSDEVLDMLNEEHKRTGSFPVSVVQLD